MSDILNHPKLYHAAVVRAYTFTEAEYFSFVQQLLDNKIDFYVSQVGPGKYYRFVFKLDDVPWYLPFDRSGINKSPLKLPERSGLGG